MKTPLHVHPWFFSSQIYSPSETLNEIRSRLGEITWFLMMRFKISFENTDNPVIWFTCKLFIWSNYYMLEDIHNKCIDRHIFIAHWVHIFLFISNLLSEPRICSITFLLILKYKREKNKDIYIILTTMVLCLLSHAIE